jgi:membrane associated rhomboid family serine protease
MIFKTNLTTSFVITILCVIYTLQQFYCDITPALGLHLNNPQTYEYFTCMFVHGPLWHIFINLFAVLIIFEYRSNKDTIILLLKALCISTVACIIYKYISVPKNIILGGFSGVISAVLGIISWTERKTSKFRIIGTTKLLIPIWVFVSVLFISEIVVGLFIYNKIAWQMHNIAILLGLAYGIVESSMFGIFKRKRVL